MTGSWSVGHSSTPSLTSLHGALSCWKHHSSELGKQAFVKDAWIKPSTKLSWKKTCFLLLWQCSPTLRSVFSSRTMFHATQPGQWRCGWRTTTSGSCHGQPNLQTWIPLKTSGMWHSHPTAMWKTGGEHVKTHESCDCKSRLFHQILISKLFLS